MPAYYLPGSEKKIDGTGRPKIIIQNKMSSSKTIKARLTIEREFTRQEVYDAIRSNCDLRFVADMGMPTEKQMDAIWARLSGAPYADISEDEWDEREEDISDKMKGALAHLVASEGLLEEDKLEEDKPPTEYAARIARVEAFQKLMTKRKIPEQDWGSYWGASEANRKEIDETNGWEYVYNAGNQTKGNPLGVVRRENPLLPGQEGIFYQTYGNGGGAGGSGGYWAMPGASWETPGVYQVAGEEFTLLEGVELEFRPEHSWTGVVAAVRILPLTQERIAETRRELALYQQAVAKREWRRAAAAE
jgi:hypothetical protein